MVAYKQQESIIVLEAGSLRSGLPVWLGSDEGPLPGSWGDIILLSLHMSGGAKELSGFSFIKELILLMRASCSYPTIFPRLTP